MSFQIKNKEGAAMTMKELDAEAAEFWKRPVDPKYYAQPEAALGSWYDIIGWEISEKRSNYASGWDGVKCGLFKNCMEGGALLKAEEEQIEKLKGVNQYLKPYFALIDFWKEKGHEPIQVNE